MILLTNKDRFEVPKTAKLIEAKNKIEAKNTRRIQEYIEAKNTIAASRA